MYTLCTQMSIWLMCIQVQNMYMYVDFAHAHVHTYRED